MLKTNKVVDIMWRGCGVCNIGSSRFAGAYLYLPRIYL